MYLSKAASQLDKAVVQKLLVPCPSWPKANESAGVYSSTSGVGKKAVTVSVLPRVSVSHVRRILRDARRLDYRALDSLAMLFRLGIGVPLMPQAADFITAHKFDREEHKKDLTALIKAASHAVREARLAYGLDLKALMPAELMLWLLHVRDYMHKYVDRLSENQRLILIVYRKVPDSQTYRLADGYILYGERGVPASIGHHLLRMSNATLPTTFTDSSQSDTYIGVLATVTYTQPKTLRSERDVDVDYVLKHCSEDDFDVISMELYAKQIAELDAGVKIDADTLSALREDVAYGADVDGLAEDERKTLMRALAEGDANTVNTLQRRVEQGFVVKLFDSDLKSMPAKIRLRRAVNSYMSALKSEGIRAQKLKSYDRNLRDLANLAKANLFTGLVFNPVTTVVISPEGVKSGKNNVQRLTDYGYTITPNRMKSLRKAER